MAKYYVTKDKSGKVIGVRSVTDFTDLDQRFSDMCDALNIVPQREIFRLSSSGHEPPTKLLLSHVNAMYAYWQKYGEMPRNSELVLACSGSYRWLEFNFLEPGNRIFQTTRHPIGLDETSLWSGLVRNAIDGEGLQEVITALQSMPAGKVTN